MPLNCIKTHDFKVFRMRSYKTPLPNPFRMRSCKNTGWGRGSLTRDAQNLSLKADSSLLPVNYQLSIPLASPLPYPRCLPMR